jgi:hypothetical protein
MSVVIGGIRPMPRSDSPQRTFATTFLPIGRSAVQLLIKLFAEQAEFVRLRGRAKRYYDQAFFLSGRADSNRRPLDPQSSALTKLRHGPLTCGNAWLL